MLKPNTGELIFFWILFGVVGLLSYGVMSSYLIPLFLAGVFCVLFAPVFNRILRIARGKVTISALVTVLLILVVILIPLVVLGILMFQEVLSLYDALGQGGTGIHYVDSVVNGAERYIQQFVPQFAIHTDINTYIVGGLRWVAGNLDNFFTGIFSFFFQTLLMIIAMFFFYRDGKKLRDFAIKWSPLSDNYDKGLLFKVETAVNSVVRGSLVTALVQGTLVGIGFFIFGIPDPIFWGVVSTIAALVPLIGTSIITVPAAGILLLEQHVGGGIGLLLWAVIVVGLSDNFLRPILINRGVNIHPFVIFLSVLGGLAYFGPIGFLAGPIIIAFFYALLDIYPSIVRGHSVKVGE